MSTADGAAPTDATDVVEHATSGPARRRDRLAGWFGGRSALVAAMAVGVGVRLLLVAAGSGTTRFTNADTASYVGFAEALPRILWEPDAQGLAWSLQRTPGYPVVLWVLSLGGSVPLTWVVVVQCVVGGAVTVALTHVLGRRCSGPTAAGVAAWLVALDPASVGHSLLVGTETVFTAALLVAILALERLVRREPGSTAAARSTVGAARSTALGVGAAVGVLALIRPVMLYAAPVVAVVVWWAHRAGPATTVGPAEVGPAGGPAAGPLAGGRTRSGAVALALLVVTGAALPIGAWFARNASVSDAVLFSSTQGHNLFDIGAAAKAAEEGRTSIRPGDVDDGWAELDTAGRALLAEHRDELAGLDMSDPVNQDREWGRIGRGAILEHPRGYAIVVAQSLVRTVAGPAHSLVVAQLPASWQDGASPVVAVGAAGWLGLEWALTAIGTVVAWRSRARWTLAVLIVPVAYYLFVSAGPQMYPRFRVPVAPMVCVLAGLGAATLLAGRRSGPPGGEAG